MRTLKLILGALVALLAVATGLVVTFLFVVAGFVLALGSRLFGRPVGTVRMRWQGPGLRRVKQVPAGDVTVTDVTVTEVVEAPKAITGAPPPTS
jgi:hypothetical protein